MGSLIIATRFHRRHASWTAFLSFSSSLTLLSIFDLSIVRINSLQSVCYGHLFKLERGGAKSINLLIEVDLGKPAGLLRPDGAVCFSRMFLNAPSLSQPVLLQVRVTRPESSSTSEPGSSGGCTSARGPNLFPLSPSHFPNHQLPRSCKPCALTAHAIWKAFLGSG